MRNRLVRLWYSHALTPAVVLAGRGDPGTGIAGTAHDFSNIGHRRKRGAFTTGECTFCHTPHQALSTLLLWNHTLSTTTYHVGRAHHDCWHEVSVLQG